MRQFNVRVGQEHPSFFFRLSRASRGKGLGAAPAEIPTPNSNRAAAREGDLKRADHWAARALFLGAGRPLDAWSPLCAADVAGSWLGTRGERPHFGRDSQWRSPRGLALSFVTMRRSVVAPSDFRLVRSGLMPAVSGAG